jgi:predicted nucleic acid-binding protein
MYLVDTNVVSELRKVGTARAAAGVVRWIGGVSSAEIFLSAISVLELEIGVLRKKRKDPVQAKMLREWLHGQVVPSFGDRIIAVDVVVAVRCAELHVPATVAYYDALIAATALVHGLTVVTRNVKDFVPMGVKVLNPWEA